MKKHLVVGGVPEHFNMPWHLAIESGFFGNFGIDVEWHDYKGGTGAMCKDLREKKIDVAVLLTEGIVADIIKGNDCKIVQFYIKSPLNWGVHVNASSPYQTIADLENTRAAISRYGSGSHMMAYVMADDMGWNLNDLNFDLVSNIDGGRKALDEGSSDYFLWEKLTTKPYVDNGEFRRVGVCPTPWSSFVIAVRNDVLENSEEHIDALLEAINQSCRQFTKRPDAEEVVAWRYGLKLEDVHEWYLDTEWALDSEIDTAHLKLVQERLLQLGRIDHKVDLEDLCWEKHLYSTLV